MRNDEARASRRQLVIGLVVLPLSLLPFLLYAWMTPEGRLLRDKAELALAPPELGALDVDLGGTIPMYRNAVMPLVYHGVGSTSSGEGDFAVSPERFGEHLAALRAAGVHFVTPERVVEAFNGGRALPTRAVLLTFDDGRTDAMMWATPLLEQAKASATMFVITGAAADRAVYYADWNALERYDRGPWNLQSHTDGLHVEHEVDGKSLPALTSVAEGESIAEYQARISADLDRADDAIEAHTGRKPVAFAYPFGAYGADRTNHPRVRRILAAEIAERYELAFQQDDQETIELATQESDRLRLRRMVVGDWSGEHLVRRIAAAVQRTSVPGDELELTPPVVVAAPALEPPVPSAVAAGLAPAPASRSTSLVRTVASAPAAALPSPTPVPVTTPTTAPPPAPAPSPPTTPAPAPATDAPGNGKGRETAPGQQRKP